MKTSNSFKLSPKARAASATAVFAIALAIGCATVRPFIAETLPIIIFMVLLIANTYFSIELFSKLIPDRGAEHWIDLLLALFYVILAFMLGSPLAFTVTLAVFFIIATIKYLLVFHKIGHHRLMRRKVVADALGAFMAAFAAYGVASGHSLAAIWAMTGIFSLANVYIFFIRRLYKLGR